MTVATQRSRASRRVPPLRPKRQDTPARRCHCDTTVTRDSASHHHCVTNPQTRQRAATVAIQRSRAIQRVTTIATQTPRHASAPLPLRLNGHARFSESPPLRHKRQDTPARRCHCDSTVPPRLGPAHHCDPNTQTHQRAAAIATQRSPATRPGPPLRPKHPDTPARRCHCDTTVTRHSACPTIATQTPRHTSAPLPLRHNGHPPLGAPLPLRPKRSHATHRVVRIRSKTWCRWAGALLDQRLTHPRVDGYGRGEIG